MIVKPFQLKLAKVSSQQQEILRAVMSFLPKTAVSSVVHEGIAGVMAERLGPDTSFELESVAEMTHGAFTKTLTHVPIVVALTCVPVNHKACLQIDDVIAHVAIERMLGGEHDGARAMRSPTDTEQGVLQYLILMLLERLQKVAGKAANVHFRFDRFALDPADVEGIAEADAKVVVLTYRVTLGDHAGFVRLVLPNPLVEAAFLDVPTAALRSDEELSRDRAQLNRFKDVATVMWIDAGRTTLTPDELANIERDDVVLFDESDIILGKDGAVTGRVRVRIGTGSHGGFISEITTDARAAHCRLDQSFRGEGV